MTELITLKDACAQIGVKPANVRRHLPRLYVNHGDTVTAVKENGRWYVDSGALENSLTTRRLYRERLEHAASEYDSRHLLVKFGRVHTTWGSYTVHERYHTTYNSLAEAYDRVKMRGRYQDGERCNTCWNWLTIELGSYEPCTCHTCEDWGGCSSGGTWPVLSRSCDTCGWMIPEKPVEVRP